VGKPLDFSRFEGLAGNRFIERAVIDEVMYELMRLSGQEYVDLYAAQAKALDKEAAKSSSDAAADAEAKREAERVEAELRAS
jgi:1-acyl-sn-glycerol-3-phosphate acyltransferase